MNRVMTIALIAALSVSATAADWAEFLGPNRTGVSAESLTLERWPSSGLREVWSVKTGQGFGGAAIAGDEAFILDRIVQERFILRCFNLKTGEEKWSYGYEKDGMNRYQGSRSTPTVTDKYVVICDGFGKVSCVSRETHKPVWSLDIQNLYGEATLNWGFAQSPLVYKDTVILTAPQKDSPVLFAVNLDTGEKVWECDTKAGGDYYNSPVIRTVQGEQGVMIITPTELVFANPDNGKTIWEYDGYNVKFSIPSPTVLPDGEHIFITGGYDAGSQMIRVVREGDDYAFRKVYALEEGSQLHPAIFHEGHLYVNINENSRLRGRDRDTGGLAAIEPASGRILWRTGENPSFDRGNLIKVGGRLIMLEGQIGDLYLIEATPKGFQPISSFPALPQERPRGNNIWAPIAIGNGYLLVRDQGVLKCFDIGARAALAD